MSESTYRHTTPARPGVEVDPLADLRVIDELIEMAGAEYPGILLLLRRRAELLAARPADARRLHEAVIDEAALARAADEVVEAYRASQHVGYGSHYGQEAREKLTAAIDALAREVERNV